MQVDIGVPLLVLAGTYMCPGGVVVFEKAHLYVLFLLQPLGSLLIFGENCNRPVYVTDNPVNGLALLDRLAVLKLDLAASGTVEVLGCQVLEGLVAVIVVGIDDGPCLPGTDCVDGGGIKVLDTGEDGPVADLLGLA
jgi:hypothetical protein